MVVAAVNVRHESGLPLGASSQGLHEQKVSAAFRAQQLTAVPSELLTLKNLVRIDLSLNQITRFPGALVAAEMLRLEVLLLQGNLLFVLEDILALAPAPRLRELNVLHNPLRLQDNRVYLLEALLSQPGSDEGLLAMTHKDEQLKFHDGGDGDGDSDGYSHRRADAARAYGVRAHTASSAQCVNRSRRRQRHSVTAMTYRKKLPRKRGFPMLMKLNDEWITDREVKDVEGECGHAIEYFKPRVSGLRQSRSHPSESSSDAVAASTSYSTTVKHAARSAPPPLPTRKATKNRPASATADPLAADHTGRRFDGSRMTIKQMLRNEARSAGIPVARVIQRFRIDADTGDEVAEPECEGNSGGGSSAVSYAQLAFGSSATKMAATPVSANDEASPLPTDRGGLDDRTEEQAIVHRLFQPSNSSGDGATRGATAADGTDTGLRSFVHRVTETPELTNARSNHSIASVANDSDMSNDDDDDDDLVEPWNYPISTFDALGSEDRQYVRAKSKQSGETLERDDHFFASSIFLDCVAQAERSRRLTVRAVDLLSQQHQQDGEYSGSNVSSALHTRRDNARSMPALPTCTAVSTLTDNLTAKFSKHLDRATYEKVAAFQEKQLSVDALHIQAAVGDYYQSEHMLQRQRTNQLLSAAQSTAAADRHLTSSLSTEALFSAVTATTAEMSIESSLSKLKLRNAVDLANTLLDSKQQKHMLQTLLDADERMIDEERVMQEQTAHRFRLKLIHARQYTPSDAQQIGALVRQVTNTSSASPWQRRNWKAVEVQRQCASKQEQASRRTPPSPSALPKRGSGRTITTANRVRVSESTSTDDTSASTHGTNNHVPRFRNIESVERAAQDPLAGVNSHDLLVRCAEIRQHADRHMRVLAAHRDAFHEHEAEWECMRQDPTNLVRRRLKRRLYEPAHEVQIGSTQVVYSSLFQ